MEERTQRLIALGLVGTGLGVGVYAWEKSGFKLPSFGSPQNYIQGQQVTFSPTLSAGAPYPLGASTATVTWQNPGTAAVTYGVQGYIIAGNSVDGHWWTAASTAQSALQAARTGGSGALAQFAANIPNRVAVVTVQPGAPGTARLYANLAAQEQETWIFLIRPTYTGGLVAIDPQGAPAGNIAQVGDAGLTVQTQVG